MTKRRIMTSFLHLFCVNEIPGHQTVGLDVTDSQFVSGHQNRLNRRRIQLASLKGNMLKSAVGFSIFKDNFQFQQNNLKYNTLIFVHFTKAEGVKSGFTKLQTQPHIQCLPERIQPIP